LKNFYFAKTIRQQTPSEDADLGSPGKPAKNKEIACSVVLGVL
jgi:hypothetical protein